MRLPMVMIVLALLALQVVILHAFGQPTICECGTIKVWEGVVRSSGNSQHLTDWYTFTHIIHGFLFYLLLWWLFPRLPFWQRLAMATGIEVAWELVENTPIVIQHYREQALAQGYTGDSIINSIGDTGAMMAGFFLASQLPLYATISIGVLLELWVGFSIRDNWTLNVINLIHQFDFIRHWQSGA